MSDIAADDRALLFGALLWMADKLRSHEGEHAATLWRICGKRAIAEGQMTDKPESQATDVTKVTR